MLKINIYFSAIMVMFLMMTSCGTESNQPLPSPFPASEGDAEDFEKMVIQHGLSTFQEVIADETENVLISPLSLQTALYMTMNGTCGTTLEEFRTALKSDEFYPDALNTQYKNLVESLEPKNSKTKLGLANSVFYYDKMVEVHEAYEDVIKENYDADFYEEDFTKNSAVDRINDWAKDKTEGRIEKVLDNINDDEALFLLNALYFKSDWANGFEPSYTTQKLFTGEGENLKMVDMMVSDDLRSNYRGTDFNAVDLKFTDDEYSMTFVLPSADSSPDKFVNGFTEEGFYEFYLDLYATKLQESRVQVSIPKFEIEAHKNMNETLMEMGLKEAFTNADLCNMGDFVGQTYISRVLHDTYLKIDEKGAEGAAVTTVGVGVESLPPSITFDRPFFFIIRHVATNTPIFIGKYGDPS